MRVIKSIMMRQWGKIIGLTQKIIRTNQSKLHPDIQVTLIDAFHTEKFSFSMSVIFITFLMGYIGHQENIPSLFNFAVFIYIPVSAMRIIHVFSYPYMPLHYKARKVHLLETSYIIMTLSNSICVFIMSSLVMLYGSYNAQMVSLAIMVPIGTMVATRNAYIQKVSKIQAVLLISPYAIGMLFNGGTYQIFTSICAFAFIITLFGSIGRQHGLLINAQVQAHKATNEATYDSLTGLYNRKYFFDKIHDMKSHGEKFSILMIDLDRFKPVNDVLGHAAGDMLLKEVATRLNDVARNKHMKNSYTECFRFGGDEFIMLTKCDAVTLAKNIISELGRDFLIDDNLVKIGCSVGIANNQDVNDIPTLIRHVDTALYSSKENGRNQYQIFDATMYDDYMKQNSLEQDLHRAIDNNEIDTVYQPIVSLDDGNNIVSMETLARWNHPSFGTISPATFIKMAENTGKIHKLTTLICNKAIKDAMKWDNNVNVSINFSPLEFRNPELLLATLKTIIKENNIDSSRLIIEMTESTMIHDLNSVLSTIQAFKDMNIKIAMDDFGSGYSSLSYLHQIPFDIIKIDKSLVQHAKDNDIHRITIKAICDCAKVRNAKVVVEGVETMGEAFLMRALGATHAQGYLFGRPSRITDIPSEIKRKKIAS